MNNTFIQATSFKHLAGVLAMWMLTAVLGAVIGSSVVGGCQASVPTVPGSSSAIPAASSAPASDPLVSALPPASTPAPATSSAAPAASSAAPAASK